MLCLEGEVFSVSILEVGWGTRTGVSAFSLVQFMLLCLVSYLNPQSTGPEPLSGRSVFAKVGKGSYPAALKGGGSLGIWLLLRPSILFVFPLVYNSFFSGLLSHLPLFHLLSSFQKFIAIASSLVLLILVGLNLFKKNSFMVVLVAFGEGTKVDASI